VSLALAVATVLAAGCNLFNNTSPSTTATTDTFSGALAQSSSVAFTFTMAAAGNVAVTLTALTPSSSSAVGLGIGTPNGSSCAVTNSTSAAIAGTIAQLTTTENPGTYCIKLYDVGNLTATVTVTVTVAHF
jgi:hypothetical protein